jgi:hypothetical protein
MKQLLQSDWPKLSSTLPTFALADNPNPTNHSEWCLA